MIADIAMEHNLNILLLFFWVDIIYYICIKKPIQCNTLTKSIGLAKASRVMIRITLQPYMRQQ